MEAVGVAASITALIDLSAKIASVCLQYSKDVKNAKDDILRLLQEVNSLRSTSDDVKRLLDGPKGTRLKSSQKLSSAVNNSQCKLEKIRQELEPRGTRKAMSRVGIRALKWPFSSKDVEKSVQELTRCTQSMTLALQIDQTYAAILPSSAYLVD